MKPFGLNRSRVRHVINFWRWVRMEIRDLVMHTKLRDSAARCDEHLNRLGNQFEFGTLVLSLFARKFTRVWGLDCSELIAAARHHQLLATIDKQMVPVTRTATSSESKVNPWRRARAVTTGLLLDGHPKNEAVSDPHCMPGLPYVAWLRTRGPSPETASVRVPNRTTDETSIAKAGHVQSYPYVELFCFRNAWPGALVDTYEQGPEPFHASWV